MLKRTLCNFCHEESAKESKRRSLVTLLLKSMGIMGVLVFVVRQHPLPMTLIYQSIQLTEIMFLSFIYVVFCHACQLPSSLLDLSSDVSPEV